MNTVSVICLCYNQAPYVIEAIRSVLNQTYSPIQLIVVDDASTDQSAHVIREFLKGKPDVKFLALEKNVGNCRAFNLALPYVQGSYLIDLAADDVLLPGRVEAGVKAFVDHGVGVHFCDAKYIDTDGSYLRRHSDKYSHDTIPQGYIYKELISRFFICPPSVMFRKEVIDHLGGYDEELAYEDFDFWIRSSRRWKYAYSPEVLVRKRLVENSMSAVQFSRRSRHQYSTYLVCRKIFSLNRTDEERLALSRRLAYETRMALRLLNFGLMLKFVALWFRNLFVRH